VSVGADLSLALDQGPVRLRTIGGEALNLPVHRWFAAASIAEQRALDHVIGPALDIGCGPGRHLVALAERRVFALGIDISGPLLDVARGQGVNVLERSVFDRVPGVGKWRSALLLDGNIGIGGDPVALLARVGELLTGDGVLIVELEPLDSPDEVLLVRAETPAAAGPWFRWTTVGPSRLEAIARTVDYEIVDAWDADDRLFARLRRR
jgi:SAM-dependent methyltransferase